MKDIYGFAATVFLAIYPFVVFIGSFAIIVYNKTMIFRNIPLPSTIIADAPESYIFGGCTMIAVPCFIISVYRVFIFTSSSRKFKQNQITSFYRYGALILGIISSIFLGLSSFLTMSASAKAHLLCKSMFFFDAIIYFFLIDAFLLTEKFQFSGIIWAYDVSLAVIIISYLSGEIYAISSNMPLLVSAISILGYASFIGIFIRFRVQRSQLRLGIDEHSKRY